MLLDIMILLINFPSFAYIFCTTYAEKKKNFSRRRKHFSQYYLCFYRSSFLHFVVPLSLFLSHSIHPYDILTKMDFNTNKYAILVNPIYLNISWWVEFWTQFTPNNFRRLNYKMKDKKSAERRENAVMRSFPKRNRHGLLKAEK